MAVEFLPGNRLTLLRSGVEYFPALEAAIREARREVFIETYIYAGDATGERITRALCGAARRGAAVHVLVDGFGSRDMPAEFARELRGAGARLLVFRPEVWRFPFRRDRLRRMHRKIAVADGRVAFVGGINIIDDMDTPRQVPPRYDYAVKIEGPLLGPLQESAVSLWNRVALARLEHGWRVSHPVPPHLAHAGSQRAALAVRDNLRHRRGIEDVLLYYASRALYGTLLEAGVELYEYQKSFMHAKVAVIDGDWATVGSSNIDPFSLLLAREANVVVEDRRFAAELRARLRADIEHGARVVAKTRWFRQPLWKRIPNWIGYGVARFAIGMFGVGGRF